MGKAPEQSLHSARHGEEAAFLSLFDDHHAPLFRFAWRLTGSMADAEDIVQECFLALLQPGCSFDPARMPSAHISSVQSATSHLIGCGAGRRVHHPSRWIIERRKPSSYAAK
jgi:hypothetical protein